MEALHDKSPQRGEVCILEAFLLWIANSVGSPGVALTPTLIIFLTLILMQTSFSTPACT
jgi:hypothetical protein